ncbi:Mov34/MPN/PAD-1 family protein [Sphingobium sp.]|uniref:Mov34/MPN/PAD-1 family protein n=1 Tax=Sphingobium sp. TaxID=1912891 RepID=UPI003B3A05BC
MRVEISRTLLEQIVALAAADANEVCGLLLGTSDRIEAIMPAANIATDPARHFELDPAILIAAHRAARTGGPAIIGHYHSHPSGVAAPSITDAACATSDGSLWLIVAGHDATLWRTGPDTAVNVHFTKIHLDSR